MRCCRWFDKGEEDGLIRRRLKLLEAGGENTDYTVLVGTSDIRGAGTDANVYLEMFGERDGQEVKRDEWGRGYCWYCWSTASTRTPGTT